MEYNCVGIKLRKSSTTVYPKLSVVIKLFVVCLFLPKPAFI